MEMLLEGFTSSIAYTFQLVSLFEYMYDEMSMSTSFRTSVVISSSNWYPDQFIVSGPPRVLVALTVRGLYA